MLQNRFTFIEIILTIFILFLHSYCFGVLRNIFFGNNSITQDKSGCNKKYVCNLKQNRCSKHDACHIYSCLYNTLSKKGHLIFWTIVPFSMLLLTSTHKLLYILPKTNTITSLNGCWWLMACHKNDKIYDSLSYEIRILIFVGLYIYILLVVLGFGMYMCRTIFASLLILLISKM